MQWYERLVQERKRLGLSQDQVVAAMSKYLPAGESVGKGALCSWESGRTQPKIHHALALALKAEDAVRTCSYEANSGEIRAYLRGESLEMGNDPQTCSEKGWALVLADGFPLGWGKLSGGLLKNHYPKGLRISG